MMAFPRPSALRTRRTTAVPRPEHSLLPRLGAAELLRSSLSRAAGRGPRRYLGAARRSAVFLDGAGNPIVVSLENFLRTVLAGQCGASSANDGWRATPQEGYAFGSRKNISTRRFCARPLSVLFSAIGSRSPRPSIEMRDGETPRSAR